MSEDVEQLLREGRRAAAMDRLIERYRAKVFHFAAAILGDRTRAEDVTQDVFLRAWKGLAGFDRRGSLSAWLYAITRNACYSAARAESRRRVIEHAGQHANQSPAPLPLAVFCDERLERAVARLPDTQRHVLTLFYMHAKDIPRVAALLDMPEGTVKSHLFRARKTLAETIGPNPAGDV